VAINSLPSIPSVTEASRCGPGAITFSVSSANIPAEWEARLFAQSSGGVPIAIDRIPPYELLSRSVETTTTFYIEYFNTANGCSSPRAAAIAKVNPSPAPPIAIETQRCGAGDITVTIFMGNPPGNEIRIYDYEVSGQLIAADAVFPYEFTFTNQLASVTYYAEAIHTSTGCTSSNRSPIVINIKPVPQAPFAEGVARCGNGNVNFSVFSSNLIGSQVRLYSQAAGGTVLATDATEPFILTTPLLTTSTTFYIGVALEGCESERIPVSANIISIPSPLVLENIRRCGAGDVAISFIQGFMPGSRIRIYNTPISSIPLQEIEADRGVINIPGVIATTTYYVSAINRIESLVCEGPRTPVEVAISTTIARPVVSNVTLCGGGNAVLTALANTPRVMEMRLYSSLNATEPLERSLENPATFTLLNITTTTTYYISAVEEECEGVKVPVTVFVQAQPSIPQVSDVTRCGAGNVAVTVGMGRVPGNEIRLFDAIQGGNLIAIATNSPYVITLPNVTTTTTYYVASTNASCSSIRIPFVVKINTQPIVELPNTIFSRCGVGNISLSFNPLNSEVNEVRLYADNVSPTPTIRAINPPFIIELSNLTSSTFYFLSYVADNCESERQRIRVEVLSTPSTPIARDVFSCANVPVTITALMGAVAGSEILLYDAQGNLLEVDNSAPYLFTRNLNNNVTTNFFLTSRNKECESAKVPVSITVASSPSIPFASNVVACSLGTVQITAQMGVVRGNELRLYSSVTATTPLQVLQNEPYIFTLSNFTTNAIYYISSAINSGSGIVCESSRTAVSVSLSSTQLSEPKIEPVQRCGIGNVTLTATNFTPNSTTLVYSAANSITPIAISTNQRITLSNITTTTTYFVAYANERCTTNRIAVVVHFATQPAEPSVTNVRRCGAGTVNLSVIPNNQSFSQLRLYEGNNNVPISIITAAPYIFNLPSVSTTTLYFVSVVNMGSAGMCESNRVPLEVEITQTPSLPLVSSVERCGPGKVTITVQPGTILPEGFRLYSTSQGGIRITEWAANQSTYETTVTTTTAFFVSAFTGDCETRRVAIPITVNPVPAAPPAKEQSICGNQQVTFTLSDPSNTLNGIRVYTTPSANNFLLEDLLPPYTFTTPVLTTQASYYIVTVLGNCESERIEWRIHYTPLPPVPNVNDVSRCGAGNVTFSIESPIASQVNIYTQPVSTVPLAATQRIPFRFVANITTTTTYYFSVVVNGCESNRTPGIAFINLSPSAPIANDVVVCNQNSATITAQMGSISGSQMRLYTLSTGGIPISVLDTSPYNFTVSLNENITTFYLSAASEDCESERIPVVVQRNFNNVLPIIPNITRCSGENINLEAELPTNTNGSVAVYADANRQRLVAISTSRPYVLSLGIITTTTTFYATSIINNCESATQPFVVNIVSRPEAPVLENISACGISAVTFTITNFNSLLQYNLFSTQEPNTALNIERNGNLLTLNNPRAGNYLVEASNGVCSARSAPIRVQIGLAPTLNVVSENESCFQLGRIRANANSNRTTSFVFSLYRNNELLATNTNGFFNNLQPGAYRLTVDDNNGCIVERNIQVDSIAAPQNLTATNILQNGATLSWSEVVGATSYILRYRSVPAGRFITVENISTTSYTITNLLPSSRYEFQVQAICSNGRTSPFSQLQGFTTATPTGSCPEPASVSVVPEITTATVIWSRVPNALTYNLRFRQLPNGVFVERNFVTGTSFILSGLLPNTSYEVQVQANCSANESSSFSTLQRFTTLSDGGVLCTTPQNVTVEPSTNSATVSWSAVNNARGYQLRYRERFGVNFIEVNNITATTYVIPSLNQSTIYEVQVRAICGSNTSEYTNLISFQTEGTISGICITPVNFRIESRTSTTALASWTPNTSGAVCYILRYGPLNVEEEGWNTLLVPHPGSSIEIPNLTPGVEYGVRINTNCSACSPRSGQQTPVSRVYRLVTVANKSQGTNNNSNFQLQVYPNPTRGKVDILLNEILHEPLQIEILDLSGKILKQWRFNSMPTLGTSLDLESLQSGAYICRIFWSSFEQNIKLLKY
ncbi:MAG: fibronectin type III domain-containing protein, partial [Bacteroidia bacterium]|nr:fibronectin type III domain-containing protein [Bacteroidia bacterium]